MTNLPAGVTPEDIDKSAGFTCPCCKGDGCEACDDTGEVSYAVLEQLEEDLRESFREDHAE